jgi:hypothetical protein
MTRTPARMNTDEIPDLVLILFIRAEIRVIRVRFFRS